MAGDVIQQTFAGIFSGRRRDTGEDDDHRQKERRGRQQRPEVGEEVDEARSYSYQDVD